MRRVQLAALDLAEAHGWSSLTVERIAERARVGPATVYRNFATKERIVLWDEYDPVLLERIRARLGKKRLVRAVRDAIVEALDEVYRADRRRILRRTRLVLAEPSLHAAGEPDRAALRAALSSLFVEKRACTTELAADVAAAAVVATLDVSIRHWASSRGRSLRVVVQGAFRALEGLG